jgi:preprotein translocase subunit YajC
MEGEERMKPGDKVIIDGDVRGVVLSIATNTASLIVDVGHAIMSVAWDRVVALA